ncbi:MAG: helix-turn-helix transcriptional regulator [Clostridiaceae bacterium]|nr:helix-turn-helix transcriptional regulator [Clostridiaceae bacterium]
MNIGEKLKNLRIAKKLTQEELAQRCDLTTGFISLAERDLSSPSIATLMDLLDALDTDIKSFFNEPTEDKIVYGEEDIYSTENNELGYEILWLIPNAQKNSMEPILLNMKPHSTSDVEAPHTGEEFGYVLKGNINIWIGHKKHKLKKGETFYFKANENHCLENPHDTPASILWISSPPYF